MFRAAAVLFILFNSVSLAQSTQNDTTEYETPALEVDAGRITSDNALKYSAGNIISKSEMEKLGSWQVPDALSYTPGIYIKNYGGLGGLKTISIRGTSAQQTLIMLNGMPLNSPQNGVFDLSAFPATMTQNIELTRGGASAIYGGNAVGGVVNFLSDIPRDISMMFNAGSFNQLMMAAQLPYKSEFEFLGKPTRTGFSANIEYSRSDGNYNFNTMQFGKSVKMTRKNGDFENLSLMLNSYVNFLGSGWTVKPLLLLRLTDRGTPGAVVQGNVESGNARLEESQLFGLIGISKIFEDASMLNFSFMADFSNQVYSDVNSLALGIDRNNEYKNTRGLLKSKYSAVFNGFTADFSAEAGYTSLKGDMLQPDAGDNVIRRHAAFSADLETELRSKTADFLFNAGARSDFITGFSPAVSPMGGIIADFNDFPVLVRGSWSYNFRPPSFNEMYYLNFGNDDLLPERSHSLNLGIELSPCDQINISANAFLISTADRIIAIPKSPVSWSAQNIGEVLTRGVEFAAGTSFLDDKLNINFSYTRQLATDESADSPTKGSQIVYIPQEIISGYLTFKFWRITSGITGQYSSFRYSLPGNSYDSVLPEYLLIDLFSEIEFRIAGSKLSFRIDLKNIFDENYSIIENYPMPGRYIRAGIRAKI